MSDTVHQINMDCLINKSIYNRYLKNENYKYDNTKDKKFYRKRINNLTRELLLNQETSYLFPDIKHAFENYVNYCIHYFKTIDRSDIIQEDLNEVNLDNTNNIDNTDNIDNINNIDNIDNINLDQGMMRSINVTQTLDSFIKRTSVKKEMILPKKKKINLKDPILRKKGLILNGKKKNIANNYDEICNTEPKTEPNIEKT